MWKPNFEVFKFTQSEEGSKSNRKSGKGRDQISEFHTKLNGFINFARQIRKPKSKKLGRFPIYKLVQNDGKFNIKQKVANFKQFTEHYGFGTESRIVGYTPDHVGFEPCKLVKNDNIFLKFVIERHDEIKNNVSEDFYDEMIKSASQPRVVYTKGFEPTSPHLRSFIKDSTMSSDYSFEKLLEIASCSNFSWFCAPKVKFYDESEVWGTTDVNLKAFSGHYTSKIAGRNKEASNLVCRKVATELFRQLKTEPVKNCYLWTLLSREKDIKVSDTNGEEVEENTRIVMCTEGPMSLLLTMFAQRFHAAVNCANYNFVKYHVSGKFDADKYIKLKERENRYDYKLEADWSKYDSTIDSKVIELACMLLLSNMPNDRLHRNISYLITSSLVTKYVAVPPGVVVELNKGLPSGHPFTTLINCNANIIFWSIVGYEIYGENYKHYMDIEVYGDDAIILFKNNERLVLIDDIISKLGLSSEKLVPKLKLCNHNYLPSEDVDFLKRRYSLTGLKWNAKKMFDKFFYQSRHRNHKEQLELLMSFYETAPNDEDLVFFLRNLTSWFLTKYPGKPLPDNLSEILSDSDFNKKHVELVFKYGPGGRSSNYNEYFERYSNLYSTSGIFHKYWSIYDESEWDEWKTKQVLLLLSINFNFDQNIKKLQKMRRYLLSVRGEDWNAFSLAQERIDYMRTYKDNCILGLKKFFERVTKKNNTDLWDISEFLTPRL